MIDIETAWQEIYSQAQRHYNGQLTWLSPDTGKQYKINDFTNKQKPLIQILRIKEGTKESISEQQVNNVITYLLNNNHRMPAKKSAIPESTMDIATIASIVHLHPFLDYEGTRGNREIIVRTTSKIIIPNISTMSPNDKRQLQWGARQIREGQGKFRTRLLELYDNKCCVTGTSITNVLDAAHIIPYSEEGITEESNGLLLRADIHNLFDDGLIYIDPKTMKIIVDDVLKSTEYWKYNGTPLNSRNDGSNPSKQSLQWKMDDNRKTGRNLSKE